MSIFMIYLFVATATPLFLWIEKRKIALWHLPFLVLMWVYFILYISDQLGSVGQFIFFTLFIGNVIFAHIAAFLLYASPLLASRNHKTQP
ncbi:holin, BSH family [Seinonella peptonophila]|uniref:Holin, BSH family n=1 Tax=Seinonella peptonophila TaxID=112248 RepID=A0A1M4T632_9BACL|nr:spore morphogenesis/germination protein YwcE [Seinonella peptonophila]SHE39777.1 holin, BSH family [Seinonella peptonophila]